MFSKILASFVFLIPIGFLFSIGYMAIAYRGPVTILYFVGVAGVVALCAWPVVKIVRGTLAPWSVLTWIFVVIDLCLGFLTLVPMPFRR